MTVKPIPDGFHTITPYLIVEDACKLADFVVKTFDGQLIFKMENEAGKITHGEMKIGDSMLMFSEASDEWKPTQTMLHLYVADIDETYKKALDAGATVVREPADQFYGDRSGCVQDSFGNFWGIATHFEDVSEEEIANRASAS